MTVPDPECGHARYRLLTPGSLVHEELITSPSFLTLPAGKRAKREALLRATERKSEGELHLDLRISEDQGNILTTRGVRMLAEAISNLAAAMTACAIRLDSSALENVP